MGKGVQFLGIAAGVVLFLWVAATATTYAMMCRSPASFSAFMADTPRFLRFGVPFRPLWMRARSGRLNAGDPAPDFELETTDHSQRVRLSQMRGGRPVVLVFGSYT